MKNIVLKIMKPTRSALTNQPAFMCFGSASQNLTQQPFVHRPSFGDRMTP